MSEDDGLLIYGLEGANYAAGYAAGLRQAERLLGVAVEALREIDRDHHGCTQARAALKEIEEGRL